MGHILTKTVFLLKMNHLQLNYAFFCFEVFWGNSLKASLFSQKRDYLRSSEIIRKFFFLNKFEKGQILRKIWICCKQHFLFKVVKWDNY